MRRWTQLALGWALLLLELGLRIELWLGLGQQMDLGSLGLVLQMELWSLELGQLMGTRNGLWRAWRLGHWKES